MKVTSAKQLSAYLKDARCLQKQSQGKVADKVGIRPGRDRTLLMKFEQADRL